MTTSSDQYIYLKGTVLHFLYGARLTSNVDREREDLFTGRWLLGQHISTTGALLTVLRRVCAPALDRVRSITPCRGHHINIKGYLFSYKSDGSITREWVS